MRFIARPSTKAEGTNFVVEDTTNSRIVWRVASSSIRPAANHAAHLNHLDAVRPGLESDAIMELSWHVEDWTPER